MGRLFININAFTIKKYFVGRQPHHVALRIRRAIFLCILFALLENNYKQIIRIFYSISIYYSYSPW